MAPLVKLTDAQTEQLHLWIAQDIKYPQMRDMMVAEWGLMCSSPNVTFHRQKYAKEIQQLRNELQAQARRRERDRQSKQQRRAGLAPPTPHCATCNCLAQAG